MGKIGRMAGIAALLWMLAAAGAYAQVLQPLVHSHNDYAQEKPFRGAFRAGANSIEADVWCLDGDLYVSHDRKDIRRGNTLRRMYLKPLRRALRRGRPHQAPLQLMVDVKNGKEALDCLVGIIEKEGFRACFDTALNPAAIRLTITCGADLSPWWTSYPDYVFFDARPEDALTEAQWRKVSMISQAKTRFTKWNGSDQMPAAEQERIRAAAAKAHSRGLPFRLWGFPDGPAAWELSLDLGMDYINSDRPADVVRWLRERGAVSGR